MHEISNFDFNVQVRENRPPGLHYCILVCWNYRDRTVQDFPAPLGLSRNLAETMSCYRGHGISKCHSEGVPSCRICALSLPFLYKKGTLKIQAEVGRLITFSACNSQFRPKPGNNHYLGFRKSYFALLHVQNIYLNIWKTIRNVQISLFFHSEVLARIRTCVCQVARSNPLSYHPSTNYF